MTKSMVCLIDCWIDFWSILGPSWAPKSIQNRSKIDEKVNQKYDAIGDGFWMALGSIFDRFWDPSWLPKSIKNGSKSHSKSIPNCIWFLIHFFIDLGSILDRFWEPRWPQNRSKIDPTIDQTNHWFTHPCWIDFWSIFGHDPTWPRARLYWKNQYNFKIFVFWLLCCCIDFLIDFWSILGATWAPKSIQNRSRIDTKINQ